MQSDERADGAAADRRAFLATAGKFAVITPPAMTLLLSTSLSSPAIAHSGRGGDDDNQGDNQGDNNQGNED